MALKIKNILGILGTHDWKQNMQCFSIRYIIWLVILPRNEDRETDIYIKKERSFKHIRTTIIRG